MSDIGILTDWPSFLFLMSLLGAPGVPLGAILGVIAWRKHRVAGAILGAVIGFGIWLLGWFYFSGNL
jgi:Na+/proline symporter